jgi:hypothetical protein
MTKKLDQEITTLDNFRHSTKDLNGNLQMFVQNTHYDDDSGALIEITEVQLILPKTSEEEPFLVLRTA